MRTTDVNLKIEGLNVHYGQAHALQDVSMELTNGVLAVVGRNGMGKSTLCKAITGMVPASGSVRFNGQELIGLAPHDVTHRGVAYVPQGRRVWRSLTVDETLQLAAKTALQGAWTVDRVYQVFPRLAERKSNGGAQLSGGEQQMLAIGRALLFNPQLLVMDEPTEGLAPVIVEQVASLLKRLADERSISVLLIEQNLGVALEVADRVAVMVNGRIQTILPAAELAADRALQQRLLGVSSGATEGGAGSVEDATATTNRKVMTLVRQHGSSSAQVDAGMPWRAMEVPEIAPSRSTNAVTGKSSLRSLSSFEMGTGQQARKPQATRRLGVAGRAAYVVGTFDTKETELNFIRQCIERTGTRVVTVDLSTSGKNTTTNYSAMDVAQSHPQGARAVFGKDHAESVRSMSVAFEHFAVTLEDMGGIISAGGAGGTALASRGMQALPVGLPKLMVSSVGSGNTRPFVGASDIAMVYSVTEIQGLNRISEQVLGNAAHALVGMMKTPARFGVQGKPALGLSLSDQTTTCVHAVTKLLETSFDCLLFHTTGVGGQSMEKLAWDGQLVGLLDISTTEIANEIAGGVFSSGPERLDGVAQTGLPYVGSCGGLDMVHFHAMDSVPDRYRSRHLHALGPQATVMRTNETECRAIGAFIADKLNHMHGPVRFLIPQGGLSALDAPGQPFWNPEADQALFQAIQDNFLPAPNRKLMCVPHHINDAAFAMLLAAAWREATAGAQRTGTH
jgi:uncharacterized protein (UPF0261 family)/ABC-type branched-subunit amino acid transport system ATPase component